MAVAIAKTLLDTLELRAGSTITQTEIVALKKRWNPHGRLARKAPVVMDDEQIAMYVALPMRVSDEQGLKGLDYLRKLLLKKNGWLRDTKLIRENGIGFDHRNVLHSLDHFQFTGFHEDYNACGNVVAMHPIYRAVSHDGTWFEYIARPWQGGSPEFGALFEELS
jgi:hypothetical protein